MHLQPLGHLSSLQFQVLATLAQLFDCSMYPKCVHGSFRTVQKKKKSFFALVWKKLSQSNINCHDEIGRALTYTIESPASKKKFFSLAKLWRHVSTMSPAGKCVAMTGKIGRLVSFRHRLVKFSKVLLYLPPRRFFNLGHAAWKRLLSVLSTYFMRSKQSPGN